MMWTRITARGPDPDRGHRGLVAVRRHHGNLTVPVKLLPGTVAEVSFTPRAKQPVAAGEVTFVMKPGDFGDSDPTNNTAALGLSVTE
jgi:hypothetical protein